MSTVSPAAEVLTVSNPITGEQVGRVPVMTAAMVAELAAEARAAQPAWAALSVRARGRLLQRWTDRLWEDRDTLYAIIRAETGKVTGGGFAEHAVIDNVVHYYARRAPGLLADQSRRVTFHLRQHARVVFHPLGVVGFITPWNYPLLNGLIDAIPALIAGNAVLIKPSELTPFTAAYAVALMHEVGIPPAVAQVVTGDGRTGAALIEVVDGLSFTGSSATGRKVAARAAERLIPCTLELGGKDPFIVLEDADLEQAAAGALRGAMENAGQACVSVERAYVVDAVYEDFIECLLALAQGFEVGNGDGYDVDMGSMAGERELARTEAHIAEAVAAGAQLLVGGRRRPDLGPRFLEPAIVVNTDHSMRIMREETFGPVLAVMRVRDAEEAVELANDSDYGLSATIYTRNLKRGEALARQLQCGDVGINQPQLIFGTPSLPMGGVKSSGVGRRGGPEGLMRFVSTQSILTDRLIGVRPELAQHNPTTRQLYTLLRRARTFAPWL